MRNFELAAADFQNAESITRSTGDTQNQIRALKGLAEAQQKLREATTAFGRAQFEEDEDKRERKIAAARKVVEDAEKMVKERLVAKKVAEKSVEEAEERFEQEFPG